MHSRFPKLRELQGYSVTDLEVFRTFLLNNFAFFVSYVFWLRRGARYRWTPIHKTIIRVLRQVDLGLENRVIFNAPPRMGKSESITILWVAWHFLKNPRCHWMEISYSDLLIASQSLAIRQIIKLPEIHFLFPDFSFAPDQEAKGLWWTAEGGSLRVASSGGQITGFEAGSLDDLDEKGNYVFSGGIIISDPVKPDDWRFKKVLDRFNLRYLHTIQNRVNSPRTPIVIEAQRIANGDLSGFLLSGGAGHKWLHVRIPSLVDKDDQERADERYNGGDWSFGRPVRLNLPDGYIWAEKYGVIQDKALLDASSEIRNAQQMQNPRDSTGQLLYSSWLRKFEAFDLDSWPFARVKRLGQLINLHRLDIFADTANKTKTQHDYTVLELWGLGDDGNAYLLDLVRGKWEIPELVRVTSAFLERYADKKPRHYGWRNVYVEDKASGTGLIQILQRTWGAHRIIPVPRSTDKVSRAMDVIIPMSSGQVWVPESAHWLPKFVEEVDAFSRDDSHAFDDQLDPMFDAVGELLGKGSIMDVV